MTPLSKNQLGKVARAMGFSFAAAFFSTIWLAGGIQSTYEANIALLWSACTSGVNAILYGFFLLFQDDSKERKG